MTSRLLAVALSFAITAAARADVGYLRDVRPILANKCFKCHGPDLKKGGLDLQDRAAALKELKSGNHALVPGKSADSEMVRRVSATDDGRMPPKGEPLTPAQVAVLKAWIDQ